MESKKSININILKKIKFQTFLEITKSKNNEGREKNLRIMYELYEVSSDISDSCNISVRGSFS